ncbi:MAG: NRDE family protein [Novosphingobium sp.]
MCIAAIAWDAHPRWQLIVAANRDEFHDRPAAPLARWEAESGVIAGRDLRSGGTWLGVSEHGRLVLVTNYRVEGFPQPERPSRGALVTGLLNGEDPTSIPITAYNPFNLLCAAPTGARVISNYPTDHRAPMLPGVHGLSNGAIANPWPKTRQLCGGLTEWLEGDSADLSALLCLLRDDRAVAGDGPEPRLSSVFINDAQYGTRCSTVVAIDRHGRGVITERRFDPQGRESGETSISFAWPAVGAGDDLQVT